MGTIILTGLSSIAAIGALFIIVAVTLAVIILRIVVGLIIFTMNKIRYRRGHICYSKGRYVIRYY